MELGKTSKTISILLLSTVMLTACSTNSSSAKTSTTSSSSKVNTNSITNGDYYAQMGEEALTAKVNGNKIVIKGRSVDGKTGTIDSNTSTIHINDDYLEYSVEKKGFSLTIEGITVHFKKGTPPKNEETSSTDDETEILKLGETAEYKDGTTLTVNSITIDDSIESYSDDTAHVVVVDFTTKNTNDERVEYSNFYFKLIDSEGYGSEVAFESYMTYEYPDYLNAQGSYTGKLIFTPTHDGPYELEHGYATWKQNS